MYKALISLVAVSGMLAGGASAHEVSASSATVTVKAGQVEILQTTPLGTAAGAASETAGKKITVDAPEQILSAMGQSWHVSGVDSGCDLARQAYRLQHHETEIQLRYLYNCGPGETPQMLKANWLEKTPSDHFLIFTIATDEKSKTVIFEHQPLSIDISQLN